MHLFILCACVVFVWVFGASEFASRLKEDTSLGLSVDTQDEFLRVKAERAKEREVETDLHREREIYSK